MITYYKLKSQYEGDITKDSSLTGLEVDNNFNYLEGQDIKTIKVNEDGLVIEKVNGDALKSENIVTKQNIVKFLPENAIYTDGTIKGNGSKKAPLSISSKFKPGCVLPVMAILSDEANLPENPEYGDRYVCMRQNGYNATGCLYTLSGVKKIMKMLAEKCEGWRVATKDDWDGMLNAIEPFKLDRNHQSKKCNVYLGNNAKKVLESSDFNLKYLGYAYDNKDISYYESRAGFWTSSAEKGICGELLNAYVKRFDKVCNGVYQDIVDGSTYFSLRLVKDIDNADIPDSESVLGNNYPVVMMPTENGGSMLWTGLNVCLTEGLQHCKDYITFDFLNLAEGLPEENGEDGKDYSAYGEDIVFIYEWNGVKWMRYALPENILFYDSDDDVQQFCYLHKNEEGAIEPISITDKTDEEIEALKAKCDDLQAQIDELKSIIIPTENN